MKSDFFKKYTLLFLCLFLIISASRYYFVETSIIQPQSGFSLNKIMPWRFIVILIINSAVFLALFRMRYAIFSIIFYILQSLYLLTHYIYYTYFKKIFIVEQFISQFSEGIEILRHGAVPFNAKHLLIFVDAPFLILLIINYSALNYKIKNNPKSINFLKNAVIIVLSCALLFASDIRSNKVCGLFTNDAARLLAVATGRTGDDNLNYATTVVINNKMEYPLQNIICIQVESLDADVVNYKYKGKYITPFLRQLSRESIYYPYMISYQGRGCTSDTEFVVLNSLKPQGTIPLYKFMPRSFPNSLLHRLARFNYETKAFHNNEGSFFNRDSTFIKMGFQQFYDLKTMHLKEEGWGASDADVFGFIKNKLKMQAKPFLYYIITMSSHEPFYYAGKYFHNQEYDDIDKSIVKGYFNSLSYVDRCLEELVTYVKGNFPNTYIFIFGDHSSILGSRFLFKNFYVPLFIITPDNKRYIEARQVVSTLDLAPTILSASQISFSINSEGVNLLDYPLKKHTVMFANISLFSKFRELNPDDYAFQDLKDNPLPPRYIAHVGGSADDKIITNSQQAIRDSLNAGFYLIELDFEWTNDNQIVLIHDWDATVKKLFNKEPGVYSLKEFKEFRAIDDIRQLSLPDLAVWVRQCPHLRIVTDVKRNNIEALYYISQEYRDIQGQFIPQIYEFNEYDTVRQLGYQDIILTLYRSNYSDDDILKFVRSHRLFALTMPVIRARSSLTKKLNQLGVFVYAHTVNSLELENELSESGVNGFYTDFLKP